MTTPPDDTPPNPQRGPRKPGNPRVGLCAECRHARVIATERSAFYQCRLAWSDPRFAKYPHLPVMQCPGFAGRD